ncbi:hypothetical protein VT03_24525 [Planctomyces sp. SH-PL14]|nr:hypothetical protein VT03_24525 [Planctomyces sp. SH-PL14]
MSEMGIFTRAAAKVRSACAVCAVLVVSPLMAADRAPADRLVPSGATVFFEISDLPALKESWSKAALGQLWNSSQMAEFRKEIEAKYEEALKDAEKEGVPLKALLELPQGEIAFAVVREEDGPVGGVAFLDYGDKSKDLETALNLLDKALEEKGAERSTDTVAGTEITVFTFKKDDGEEVPQKVAYCTKDETLVFATSADLIEGVLGRWDGKSDECLAEDEVYGYIAEKCQGDSEDIAFSYFASPIELVQGIMESNEELSFQAVVFNTYVQSLGFGQLKGVGGAAEIGGEDYDSWAKTFIYSDQPSKGVMKIFQFPAIKAEVPAWVEESVAQYSSFNWDAQAAWQGILAVGDAVQSRQGATAAMVDKLAKQPPNIHIKKDVIDQLSGKLQLISKGIEEGKDGGQPQEKQVFLLELKGESQIKDLIGRLAGMAPQVEKRDFQGTTIYEVPAGGALQPAFAVANGQLMISTSVESIEGILRTGKADKPLSANADFKALMEDTPETVSMFTFSRLDKALEGLYEMARTGKIDGLTEAEVDFSKLPEFDSVRKYFRPQMSYAIPDENGAVIENFTLPLK